MSTKSPSPNVLTGWLPHNQLKDAKRLQDATLKEITDHHEIIPSGTLSVLYDEWQSHQKSAVLLESLNGVAKFRNSSQIFELKKNARELNKGAKVLRRICGLMQTASQEARRRQLADILERKIRSREGLPSLTEDDISTLLGSDSSEDTFSKISENSPSDHGLQGSDTYGIDPNEEKARIAALGLRPQADIFRDPDEFIFSR
ncbi:hypothetical protein WOLCODRAFT_20301 [Wolfiporia cocos MD-104 SS10]|uniref:Uncharacterized protein n=1 Tax=Wolfiporia cocos (strain MD-104) TaxID=742152 RepID=A0A2H3JED0_WOLCO|nr:hypothetical protein WOLCODRAFT_20301 [Wolfiporia cocos MD-104 SS10]